MKKDEFEKEIALTDALLRLTVLEHLLISKGILTPEEFHNAMDNISKTVTKNLLKNANVPGDLDKIIEDIDQKNLKNKN